MKKTENFSEDAIINRVSNFHWDFEGYKEDVHENSAYYDTIKSLRNEIVLFCSSDKAKNMSQSELLSKVFKDIYIHNLLNTQYIQTPLYPTPLYPISWLADRVYEACFFMTLCVFLHTSKRIKGKTLLEFVGQYRPLVFDDIEIKFSTEERFRKSRNILFSKQQVYVKNIRGSGISKDSEHEWTLFFPLRDWKKSGDKSLPKSVRDTDKKLGNLYSSIIKVCKTEKDSGYEKRLMTAYSKFMSKLNKLKYKDYLELEKTFLSHDCKNTEYYGMNIYKHEDGLKPYIITHEVKRLAMCQSMDEENNVLLQHLILNDISFPKIYEVLVDWLSNNIGIRDILAFRCAFLFFIEYVVTSGCLILDELVEMGVFGGDGEKKAKWKEWEDLFRETINEMAERVFYNPCELDFAVTEESQENFVKLISAPINFFVNMELNLAAVDKPIVDFVRPPRWYSEK